MIIQGVADSFRLEILLGIHAPSDVYRMALYSSKAELSPATTVYTTDGEVIGSQGYDAGGQALSGYQAQLSNRVAYLDWADPLWPMATITARGALIYNASKQNRAVAVLDLGQDYTSTNGNFLVTLPEPTSLTALIRIR